MLYSGFVIILLGTALLVSSFHGSPRPSQAANWTLILLDQGGYTTPVSTTSLVFLASSVGQARQPKPLSSYPRSNGAVQVR